MRPVPANTDLASVFGKSKAASGDTEAAAPELSLGGELDDEAPLDMTDDEAAEAVPPDFATHAIEAFPDMDDARIDALYRAIKACHGGI